MHNKIPLVSFVSGRQKNIFFEVTKAIKGKNEKCDRVGDEARRDRKIKLGENKIVNVRNNQ